MIQWFIKASLLGVLLSCKSPADSTTKATPGAEALGGPIRVECVTSEVAQDLASPLPPCGISDDTDAVAVLQLNEARGVLAAESYLEKIKSLVITPKSAGQQFYEDTCQQIADGDSQALRLALGIIIEASSRISRTKADFDRNCPSVIKDIQNLDSFRFLRDKNQPKAIFKDDGSISKKNVLAATLSLFIHLGATPRVLAQWFDKGYTGGGQSFSEVQDNLWQGAQEGLVKVDLWDPDGLLRGSLGISPKRLTDFIEKRIPKPVQYAAGAVYIAFQRRISQTFKVGKDKKWVAQVRANFKDGYSIYFGASRSFNLVDD